MIYVRGNRESEKVESKSEKGKQTEKREINRCDQCKWYDVSTQRDFHRKVGPRDEQGSRSTIMEVRAVCCSPTGTAKGHLVKNDSDRPCFEKGKYVHLDFRKISCNCVW